MRCCPAIAALALLLLHAAPAAARQADEPVTARAANQAIWTAIGSLRLFYAPPRQRERPPECDELAGEA